MRGRHSERWNAMDGGVAAGQSENKLFRSLKLQWTDEFSFKIVYVREQ